MHVTLWKIAGRVNVALCQTFEIVRLSFAAVIIAGLAASAVAQTGPSLVITPAAPGQATVSWTLPSSEYILQETLELASAKWSNCLVAPSNHIIVPANLPSKFYRLYYTGPVTGDFSLGAPMMTQQAGQGGSTSFDIAIFPSGGFASPVNLSVSGLPAGAIGSFTPNPAYEPSSPASAAKLSINVSSSTPIGNYNLKVTGTCGTIARVTWLTLVVVTPDFGVYPSTSSRTIPPGAETRYTIFVNTTGGLASNVDLSVSGLPDGATGLFEPNPTNTSSILRVTTSTNISPGTYAITVKGVSGSLSHSTGVTLIINRSADFYLAAPMMTMLANQGESTRYSLIVSALQGSFGGSVKFTVSGLPNGASGTFDPNPAEAPDSGAASTLTVAVSRITTPGNYDLVVTGTCGGLTRKTYLTLIVVAPDFSLSPSPSSRVIPVGGATYFSIMINKLGGLSSNVSLSVSGLPGGATGSFEPDPGNPNSSLLKIATGADVAPGTYTLTVNGVCGSLSHPTSVDLIVSRSVDFYLGAPMMTMWVNQGDVTRFALLISSPGAFGGAVNLSVSGLPSEAIGSFDSNPAYAPANPGTAATLTVTTTKSTPAGNYELIVTGICGNLVRKTYLTLLVVAPDFSLYPSPSSQSIAPGQSTSYSVNVSKVGGFSNTVNLTVSGLPTGASSYWSSPAGGSPTLNVLTTANTPLGSYPLTITGTGGGITHSQTVALEIAPPDFTLNGSPGSQSIDQGESTTYTISVEALRGYDGYVRLSYSGLPDGATAWFNHDQIYTYATFNVITSPNTPAGSYTITVTGTEGGLSRSTTVMLGVNEPRAFNLSTSPASKTVNPGGRAAFTLSLNRTGGFGEPVNLSISGLPTGASASFSANPMEIMDGSQSTLTVTTGSGTPVGTYPLTITGQSGDMTRTTTATLVVQTAAAADFTLDPSPDSQDLTAGSSATYSVSIARTGGFSGAVNLSVSGLPANATGSFSPNPATGNSSTLTVNASAGTAAGTSTLKVTGTSGNVTRTANLTLVVNSSTSPDFTITASPSTRTIPAGGTAGYDLAIKSFNGFYYMSSSWDITGLPSGMSGKVVVPLPENGSPFVNITAGGTTPKGTYTFTVTATLSGGTGTKTHSTTATVVVADPDFSMSLSPDSRIVAPGGAAGFDVGIIAIAGFYYSASSWNITGLPSGMSGSVFVPLPGNGSPVLSVKTSAGIAPGSYPVTLTATLYGGSGSRTHSASATVVVHEPDFNLSLSPASATVSPGGTGGYTIQIESIAGFSYSGSSWDVTGLPSGMRGQVVVPLPENGSPFINVTTSTSSAKGSYPFTLTATLWGMTGEQTHSTTGTIVVGSP